RRSPRPGTPSTAGPTDRQIPRADQGTAQLLRASQRGGAARSPPRGCLPAGADQRLLRAVITIPGPAPRGPADYGRQELSVCPRSAALRSIRVPPRRSTGLLYRRGMPARMRPTPEDAAAARRILLDGLGRDVDIFEMLPELAPLHPRDNTFPGEVFLRLAADALDWCGASRANPLTLEGIRERFLPECAFRGRQNKKLQYAVLAAAALHGGTEPDLLDEVAWWQTDDFWQYALFATIAYIRPAASQAGVPVRQACQQLAQRSDHLAPQRPLRDAVPAAADPAIAAAGASGATLNPGATASPVGRIALSQSAGVGRWRHAE